MLKPSIQLFAEGEDPPPLNSPAPAVGDGSRTYIEDYVKARGEAKDMASLCKQLEPFSGDDH